MSIIFIIFRNGNTTLENFVENLSDLENVPSESSVKSPASDWKALAGATGNALQAEEVLRGDFIPQAGNTQALRSVQSCAN